MSVARAALLESIRLRRGDISPHHFRYSLEVTGRDNRGGCTERGGDKRVYANRGTGRAADVGCGRVEVDVCSKGSVACGFDRKTRVGGDQRGRGRRIRDQQNLNREVLATVSLENSGF